MRAPSPCASNVKRSGARRAGRRLPGGITARQLRDDAWVLGLHAALAADEAWWIGPGDVVWFMACAVQAVRKGENPGGLFRRLIENPQRRDWLDEEHDWAEAKRRIERATSGGGA